MLFCIKFKLRKTFCVKRNAKYFTESEILKMELSETIGLMQSADYKERFKAEYWQTKIRHSKLSEMIKKYEAGTLEFEPKCSICLLMAQRDYMQGYLNLLEKRAEVEGIELNGGNK